MWGVRTLHTLPIHMLTSQTFLMYVLLPVTLSKVLFEILRMSVHLCMEAILGSNELCTTFAEYLSYFTSGYRN